jgi:hypothetical protein
MTFVNVFLTRCRFMLTVCCRASAKYGTFRRISKRAEFAQQAAQQGFLRCCLFVAVVTGSCEVPLNKEISWVLIGKTRVWHVIVETIRTR